jgi:membrane-bound lytic murein transglycosylase B
VRIGGRWGVRPAVAAVRQRSPRVTRTPAFGLAVITPLVWAGAVGGAAPPPLHGKSPIPSVHAVITPVAAVSPSVPDLSGPVVIAIERAPTAFHVAAAAASAPPPPMVVSAPGALGIPSIALAAYRKAEQMMAVTDPGCGVSWNLLAGIGRIESGHAGGGAVDAHGTAVVPIYGPALDGTLAGNEVVVSSSVNSRVTFARAMGPMQFLPGTWARYAANGKGEGVPDPQNLFDSALSAALYLCSGGLNLRDPAQVMAAILRYNNSGSYAQNVLGWAAAYATGVVPVDLPPMTGPPPPLGDAHDEHPEGLGPGLPLNINGLPGNDPLAQMPLIDFSQPQLTSAPPMFPWMTTATTPSSTLGHQPGCTLICIAPQSPPLGGPLPFPPGMGPLPPDAVAPAAPPLGVPPDPSAGASPSDPLAGPAAGPPPGSAPGPAAGPPRVSPSPKPAGPPPAAAPAR